LSEVSFFGTSNIPPWITLLENTAYSLQDPDARRNILGLGVSVEMRQVNDANLRIYVQKIDTTALADLQEQWTDGETLHPYALFDIEDTKERLDDFVNRSIKAYIGHFVNEDDLITRNIFNEASTHVQANLVRNNPTRISSHL